MQLATSATPKKEVYKKRYLCIKELGYMYTLKKKETFANYGKKV
jgi:hypothetical protein